MPPNVGVGVGGRPDAQVMLAQQNREMEALERRSQRERSASMNPSQVRFCVSIRKHSERESSRRLPVPTEAATAAPATA
jgi:hypothetical protein